MGENTTKNDVAECKSVSLQNEKKTQAPNHVVIRLHDGAIKQRWDLKYTVMIRIFTG